MKVKDITSDNRISCPLFKESGNKEIVEERNKIVTDRVTIGNTQEILPYYKRPGSMAEAPVLVHSYVRPEEFRENQVALEPLNQPNCCTIKNVLKETLKIAFGLSVGAGMCPIVSDQLYNLDDYDIHVNNLDAWTTVSTINTMCTYALLGYMTMAHLIDSQKEYNNEELSACQKVALHGGKIAAVLSSALPITQLWKVELNNKKVAESEGFDEYMMWAIACTIPLLMHRTLKAYRAIEKRIHEGASKVELNSSGSQIFTIGTSVLAEIARFFIYSKSVSELSKQTGLDDTYCDIIGYIAGGVIASSVIGMMEYSSLKSLFQKQETNVTNKEVGVAFAFNIRSLMVYFAVNVNWYKSARKMERVFKGSGTYAVIRITYRKRRLQYVQ